MESSKLNYYRNLLEDMKTTERILNDREINELYNLFDEEITRQSVTSEDVADAIGDLLDMKEHWCADSTDNDAISIDLAIAALQAYQPEPPKENE